MQCPKCKKEIEDNSLKCSYCGSKVASVCKDCGTINSITSTECSGCHKVLIKICSECGAANLPNAKACRKCGIEFVQPKIIPKPEYNASKNSQQKVKTKLLEAIKDADSSVITISQLEACGVDYFDFYLMHSQNAGNYEMFKKCKAYLAFRHLYTGNAAFSMRLFSRLVIDLF